MSRFFTGDYVELVRTGIEGEREHPAGRQAGRRRGEKSCEVGKEVQRRSLTTLREKLVKIGAKVVRHGRYVTFQLAEVAVPRGLFQKILSLIDDLRPRPAPA